MTDSTWNAYDGRMTTPLLRCAPLATPRGRCHGKNDEHLRRGAGGGSPLSFLAQESQTLAYELRDRIPACSGKRRTAAGKARSYRMFRSLS
jgi:hypothetical protein